MEKQITILVMGILIINLFLISFVIAPGPNAGQGAGQDQGQGVNLQNQQKIEAGIYIGENGQQIKIQQQSNNRMRLEVNGVGVNCSLNISQEQIKNRTKLRLKLSNGKNSEIKIMPNTASEKALEKLKINVCSEENNCQIELKEVGQGEQINVAYEIQVQKQAKILGLFKTKMKVQAQVNAETGELIKVKKPWWSFLASESELAE